jgi:hypothetical protein
MLTLRPAHLLALASPVRDLSADGGRAAILAKPTDSCGPVGVWDPHGGITWLASSSCEGRIHGWWNGEFVIAAGRVAWIDADDPGESSPILVFDYVEAGTLAAGTTTVAETDEEGEWLDNLAGDGSLLVYNSWNRSKPKLWRIIGAQKASAQLLLAGQDAGAVKAVDAGRIAVLRRDGNLVILNDRGRRLSSFRLDSKGIETVRLTGSQLVVQRGAAFEVRDTKSGAPKHRWPAAHSIAPIALEDAQGNFAVYTAGIAIHLLRLSDGRDRVLKIARQVGPAHADLEPRGLFYSYNRAGSTTPGRIAFVPLNELTTRFR